MNKLESVKWVNWCLVFVVMMFSTSMSAQVNMSLTKDECKKLSDEIYSEWINKQKEYLQLNLDQSLIIQGRNKMPIAGQVFGDEPADGRSMWISMHGGGNTTQAENDEQWNNQTMLYTPHEGVYVCPRAPWNDWNMWFQQPIDSLFEELVLTMTALLNVNPNKVYLMGYSAGGDGVWRLAPRLADHWAAASMMAGHPGDVSLVNLRNLPFSMWVGAEDGAYNRNIEVVKRGCEMDSLHNVDNGGYIHENHILEGLPHWMERNDTLAVDWMANFVRNPHPSKVVWQQEEVLRKSFYWLEVPETELERGKKIIASIDGNVININHCDYQHFTIYLSDDMLNLDKEIVVKYGDRVLFSGTCMRSEECLKETLALRRDKSFMFPVKIELTK